MLTPDALLLLLIVALSACDSHDGAFPGCPETGDAMSAAVRALNRLKNRSALPADSDIDTTVTLSALLAPGDDRVRWNEGRAATIVGLVRDVDVGGVETVNCHAKTPGHRDTHIALVGSTGDDGQLPVIVEVTPGWRARAARGGADWSTDSLRATLQGRWIRVTGWLMYDVEHQGQADHTAPGRTGNWRATAWELHPVTAIDVVPSPR
jgi:hypothetical protein